MKKLRSRAPAKLIISGEHSVVYGRPAIALAVDRYVVSTVTSLATKAIIFNLLNLKYAKTHTIQTLKAVKDKIQENYHAFLNGRKSIRDVIEMPFELAQFTALNILEKLNLQLNGLKIETNSTIPIGCGMGSSAASIVSLLHAISSLFKFELDPSRILSLGLDSEKLQHGRSSGIDLHLSINGGCIRFKEGQTFERQMPSFGLNIVNTGSPITTTGECVTSVSKYFENTTIGDDFEDVTNAIDDALTANDFNYFKSAIRENNKLLSYIGVVPETVQDFIYQVEKQNGAAKICGAGSVAGNTAGVVLVASDNNIDSIAKKFGYEQYEVKGDTNGVVACN